MELITLKMGLELGALGLAAVCILFVVYVRMGAATLEKGRKQQELRDTESERAPAPPCGKGL